MRFARSCFLFVFVLSAVAAAAGGHEFLLKDMYVGHPYAKATAPGARAGGAYFTLENRGAQGDRLIAVASPAAASAEMHSMAMDGNVMRMRALREIEIPAGARVALKPGGLHVMLLDLKQPLVSGDTVPLTLTFARAGTVEVTVNVEPMVPVSDTAHQH